MDRPITRGGGRGDWGRSEVASYGLEVLYNVTCNQATTEAFLPTHVNFNHLKKRGNIKSTELKLEVERGSSFAFTSDFSCIASILFANVKITRHWKLSLRLLREDFHFRVIFTCLGT